MTLHTARRRATLAALPNKKRLFEQARRLRYVNPLQNVSG